MLQVIITTIVLTLLAVGFIALIVATVLGEIFSDSVKGWDDDEEEFWSEEERV